MFICHRKDNTVRAHEYICGLIHADRRNMERMEEAVEKSEYQALQQFISNSPWDARAVMNRVATESDKLLGGTGCTGLLIDETGISKKGSASVGVSRQWNGRLGKMDNCQVGVFGALCAGDRAVLVDVELFLPSSWTDDSARCERSGVPAERLHHRTKPELALAIIRRQRELGVRFDYVSADGLYGNSTELCRALDDDGEIFMFHIHGDKTVFLKDPAPQIPNRRSGRGRKPSKRKPRIKPVRADALFKGLEKGDLRRIKLRETTAGALEAETYRRSVWIRDEESGEGEGVRKWTLMPLSSVAEMEAQRFWIERSFEDAKSQAGMAEYQVRGWQAWHHHMALVMMTMLFMTKQRILISECCWRTFFLPEKILSRKF